MRDECRMSARRRGKGGWWWRKEPLRHGRARAITSALSASLCPFYDLALVLKLAVFLDLALVCQVGFVSWRAVTCITRPRGAA